MSTVDYTEWLKKVEEIKRHVKVEEPDPDTYRPLNHPPKTPAPHHYQVIRVYDSRGRPFEQLTQDHFFETVTLPPNHPVFTSGRSVISPITQKIGIPLVIYLEAPLAHPLLHPDRDDYVNRTITYLLVRLKSGLANMEHQDGLGTALVARLDYQPLSIGLLTTIYAYIMMLMDERYGRGTESDYQVQYTITPSDFIKFARGYVEKSKKDFSNAWDLKF